MEILTFKKQFANGPIPTAPVVVVGVVGSGNLEVMVEAVDLGGRCRVEISTTAKGFGPVWQAVIDDFLGRHDMGNILVSINDVGATPAVVSLRLDQAIETFCEGIA